AGPSGQPLDTDQLGSLSGTQPQPGAELGRAATGADDAASRHVDVSGGIAAGTDAGQSSRPQTVAPVHLGSGGLVTPSGTDPRHASLEQSAPASAAEHAAGGSGSVSAASSSAIATHEVGNVDIIDHGVGGDQGNRGGQENGTTTSSTGGAGAGTTGQG